MNQMQGVVEAKSRDQKGICINGNWYRSYAPNSANRGDTVEFDYDTNGQYNNIKGDVRVSSAAPASATGGYENTSDANGVSRQESIVRQSSIKAAVDLKVGDAVPDDMSVFEVANAIIDFVNKEGQFADHIIELEPQAPAPPPPVQEPAPQQAVGNVLNKPQRF